MSRTKNRKKNYTPRTPSLQHLPMQAKMVQSLDQDMHNSLLRLRLSGINGKDLGILVACFGQAWLLTEAMSDEEVLKRQFERGVAELTQSMLEGATELSQEVFDTLNELVELTISIVKISTKNEYSLAYQKLEVSGAVPFVDNFLIDMAKVEILEITN